MIAQPHQVPKARLALAWLIPPVIFATLATVAHWDRFRLGFDSYYYIEYAKLFCQTPPSSFGSAWPFGWPLLGTATSLLGFTAYQSLLGLASLSWLTLLILAARHWAWHSTGTRAGLLALCAAGALFSASVFVAGVYSEVPFALLAFAFALALNRWPERRAIALSAALAVAAFTVRYSGGLLLLMLGAWLFVAHRGLRQAGRIRYAWLVVGLTAAAAFALLLWNKQSTGHWSGHPRGSMAPMTDWLGIASDFGWAPPALMGGLGLRDILGFGSRMRLPFGLILLAGLFAVGWRAWRAGEPGPRRVMGALIVLYGGGLIALRCLGEFDPLHSARMFLPLLFPLLFVLAGSGARQPLLQAVFAAVLLLNVLLAIRGASREVSADIRPALVAIADSGSPDYVSANDSARTLSAYLSIPVHRLAGTEGIDPADYGPIVVLAARPANRDGGGFLEPEWREFAQRLCADRAYRPALDTPNLVVLVRRKPLS